MIDLALVSRHSPPKGYVDYMIDKRNTDQGASLHPLANKEGDPPPQWCALHEAWGVVPLNKNLGTKEKSGKMLGLRRDPLPRL